ncbi:MAG TPA: tetratricopeptide repeat protein [Xanthomonadales bacterium]|nr:tetratricopeptide repeat protein [Xanthomonadales bacterium]
MSLFEELKRRNVFRVVTAYVVAAWLLIQIAETIFPLFGFDDTPARIVVIVLAIGFIPMVVLSWAFVLTSEGLKKESDFDSSHSIAPQAGKKMDRAIMVVLAVALGYFAFDKFVLTPEREAAKAEQLAQQVEQARQAGRTEARVESYGDRSLAVMAFDDMSPEGDQQYLSDGIAEEMLNLLAKIPELRVTSRSSSFFYKGKDVRLAEVAEELNVGYVLEGSVRKSGDRVRISVQLIEVRSDTQLWSETYDRTLDDVFAIQDDIAAQVVGQLKLELLGAIPRARQTDLDAYALYLLALEANNRVSDDGIEQSIALSQQALAIDPDYVPARVDMAGNYALQALLGLRPEEDGLRLAQEAVQSALTSDPDYAPAHVLLGWIAMTFENDLAAAAQHYSRALELDPANSDSLNGAALLLEGLNRTDEAVTLLEYVVTRDPLNPARHYNLGLAYFYVGRWDDAFASFKAAQRLSPDLVDIHFALGIALLFNEEFEAALQEFNRQESGSFGLMGRAMALYALGRLDEHEAILQEFIELRGTKRPSEVAQVYAFTGNSDAAFEWLEKAIASNEPRFGTELALPVYDPIRNDTRWANVLQRMGASPQQLDTIKFEVMPPQ